MCRSSQLKQTHEGKNVSSGEERNERKYYNCIPYVPKVKEIFERYLKVKLLEMKTKILDTEKYTR